MIEGFDQHFLWEILVRFGINLIAMLCLTFGMYYTRYRDKELVTAASLFNIFVFAVLVVLSSVEFSIAAGFGLFAILALFTLRSEQITKIEISYFFGSVSIAVITAILGTSLPFVVFITALVLLGAYLLDHPAILRSVSSMKVTLDKIEPCTFTDSQKTLAELSDRLGVEVLSYRVIMVDYINDMVRMDVSYREK
jgi:hypothetical protein